MTNKSISQPKPSGLDRFKAPTPVDGVAMVFGGNMSELLPDYDAIPSEFRRGATKWNKFQSDWFYHGIDPKGLIAKDGIDKTAALKHLQAINSSFDPKHEHKEAAVAWLASLWFKPESTWSAKAVALALLFGSMMLLSACSETPTSPTAAARNAAAASSQKATTFTDLGHVDVENQTDTDDFFTFIVWDYADGVNQIDVAHSAPTWIDRHHTVPLTVGLPVDPCKTYQPDVYKGLPKAAHYTMSDVGNYLYSAPGKLTGPQSHCRTSPPPCQLTNTCDPPPSCQVTQTCTPPERRCTDLQPIVWPAASMLAWWPVYVTELPAVSAFIPKGPWHFRGLTGDDHAVKNDGTQCCEIVAYHLNHGGSLVKSLGPTLDVPDNVDVQSTDFGTVTLTDDVDNIVAVWVGQDPGSVRVISLDVFCPSIQLQRVKR